MCNGLSIQGAKVHLLFRTGKFFKENLSIFLQWLCYSAPLHYLCGLKERQERENQ